VGDRGVIGNAPIAQLSAHRCELRIVINHYKVAKHFELDIGDNRCTFARKHRAIAVEAALDDIYIIRTSFDAARTAVSLMQTPSFNSSR
jgi:hypothetical protein